MIRLIAGLLIVLAWAPPRAHAYSLRRAPTGGPVRWAASRVELRVDPELTDGDAQRAVRLVSGATDAWRGAPGAPSLVVAGTTQREPGYHPRDGENGVYLVRGEWRYGTALAITVTTTREGSDEILDADVLIADRDDLWRDEAPPRATHYDLLSTLTHELGHVLGLGESEVPGATMYARLARGDDGPRTIEADDEEGVLTIYEALLACASEHGVHGCAAVRGCSASPGSRAGAPLALFVAAALVLRRRRGRVTRAALLLGVLALASCDTPPVRSHTVQEDVLAREVVEHEGLLFTRVFTPDGRSFEIPGGARDGIVQRVVALHAPPRQ